MGGIRLCACLLCSNDNLIQVNIWFDVYSTGSGDIILEEQHRCNVEKASNSKNVCEPVTSRPK